MQTLQAQDKPCMHEFWVRGPSNGGIRDLPSAFRPPSGAPKEGCLTLSSVPRA